MTEEDDRQRISQDILKNVQAGRDLTVGNITQNFTQGTEPKQPVRSRSESLLLQAVKQEVISRLDQSLHNAVFINLGKQPQPQQVKRPWDAEIKIGSKSPEPLPAETTILEVFDRSGIDGRLLILGEPGAGKTTTMLDLAKGLCDRAEQDATAFVPVLLNLSSWKDPKQTMTAWLVEELKSKYGVRKDIGTKWLTEKQLLPLLDGLDEVKPEHQEGCVQAINRWLESDDRPLSLAVCCRREEYETVVRGQWQAETEEPQNETRMHLNGAILLQTLTDAQIQAYLTAANQPELWQTLRQDDVLRLLIKTPLWLSIALLSYEGLSLSQWQQTTLKQQRLMQAALKRRRLELLLDTYLERMLPQDLNKTEKDRRYKTEQTRRWLVFLARQLQQRSQIEFLIDQIQPSWLQSNKQKGGYRLLVALFFGLFFGLITGLIVGLLDEQNIGLLGGQNVGLIVGLFVGLLVGQNVGLDQIDPVEAIQISMSRVVRREIYKQLRSWLLFAQNIGLIGGLISGLFFALLAGLNIGLFGGLKVGLILGLIFGLNIGLVVGLPGGLIFGLIGGLIGGLRVDVETQAIPNQGIIQSVKNTLVLTTIALAIGLTAQGFLSQILEYFLKLLEYFLAASEVARVVALSSLTCLIWFTFKESGGQACIQHFALRFVLFCSGSIPWNYARFLDYCTERLLLQRVGGRYRFIHKSLQEHFASMRE